MCLVVKPNFFILRYTLDGVIFNWVDISLIVYELSNDSKSILSQSILYIGRGILM